MLLQVFLKKNGQKWLRRRQCALRRWQWSVLPLRHCITGLFLSVYRTTSDFAAISIFSCYVLLCNTSLITPLSVSLSHTYVSFYLVSLMTPLHCYAHASLSFDAIDSNSFVTCFLPCCAPTCTFPAAYMYFYDTYDVFFLQYIRTLVIHQVTSDLVSFVNNRTINSIRALLASPALLSLSSKLHFTSNARLRLKS